MLNQNRSIDNSTQSTACPKFYIVAKLIFKIAESCKTVFLLFTNNKNILPLSACWCLNPAIVLPCLTNKLLIYPEKDHRLRESDWTKARKKSTMQWHLTFILSYLTLLNLTVVVSEISLSFTGAVLRWSRGHVPPESLVVRRFKRFLRSQNAPKSKFSGVPPGTPLGELTALPIRPSSWWRGACCPPPKSPSPLSALRASFLRVSGSNPLQSWQPY